MAGSRIRIHTLVLDYGEVLCEPGDPAAMRAMALGAGIDPDRFPAIYWSLREDYDRGTDDGPAYWRRVGAAAGVPLSGGQIAALIAQDIALWTRIDPRMMAWVHRVLAGGLRVGLLSNMVPEIGADLRDRRRVFRAFTHVTYSCELRQVKPEPAIYRHALAGLGARPAETLFVDDRQVNVDAASALGMHVHLFRGHDGLLEAIEERYDLTAAPAIS
jgi:putative hydrolase of the HAD superfamily